MFKSMGTLGLMLLSMAAIVLVGLGFLMGPTHPLPWIMLTILVAIPFIHNKMISNQYITWKDEYSVGIEAMDNDHKKLLDLINQLQTAVHYYTSKEFEQKALDELIDYTKTHFAREEQLMADNDYPDLEAHKLQHQQFIDKVDHLLNEYQKDSDDTIVDALNFLKNWLVKHINGTDRGYANTLNEKDIYQEPEI